MHRNEEYQEDLWRRSFEYLKEHLSPEIMEKYGPPGQETTGTYSGEQNQDKQNETGANIDDRIKTDT